MFPVFLAHPLIRTFRLPLHDDIAEEGRGDGEGDDEREEQKMPHSEHFGGRCRRGQ